MTLKKQTGKHQQGLLQPVAHRAKKCEVLRREKSCCMCNAQEEDWIHILTCPSIEACMNREDSLAKARKTMRHWKLPNDFWTALEKDVHGFTRHPVGGAIETPFPPTYDNRRNRLKLAFREQDNIGWDNLLKGSMGTQWIEYVKKTLRIRKHQTPGKRMGTENDTCLMGLHVTIVAAPVQRSTLRR
jgi:hypothetical protein